MNGRFNQRLVVTLVMAVAALAGSRIPLAAPGGESGQGSAESGTLRTVTASVAYSSERATGKQATLVPGEFKIPEGLPASVDFSP